jgi:hypothetical protein
LDAEAMEVFCTDEHHKPIQAQPAQLDAQGAFLVLNSGAPGADSAIDRAACFC